ncbi:MAG: RNA methyltransferase [Bacteroidales bacterium]|nr:RNA methyltransferase [Bacteroidales bacterium]HQP05064.1 RNA methyltransferase [Bacteroidales bacterium]
MDKFNENILLIKYLSNFITNNRLHLFEKLITHRTRYFTIALEDIFQSHNANAVLRTCDCFGIQDVHIIENRNTYKINPDVALGSAQWLSMHHYNSSTDNTPSAVETLRKKGYRIIATSPRNESTTLGDFDITRGPFALFFGSEVNGLSPYVLNNADEHLSVPMVGFTESLNISVTAAICIHFLSHKLRSSKVDFRLSEADKAEVFIGWLKASIKRSEKIVAEFYKTEQKNFFPPNPQ